MRMRKGLAGLAVGSLMLGGVVAANPFAGAAQQDPTPTVQMDEENEPSNTTPVLGTPLLTPAIDLARAQEIALDGQTGAVVTSVDLDGDDGVLVYDVLLDSGVEVEVDATSGQVVQTEPAGSTDDSGDAQADDDDEDQAGENEGGGQDDESEDAGDEDDA